jgi:hypothetical protein
MDFYRGLRTGTVVQCEEGYVCDGAAYNNEGELIRKFSREYRKPYVVPEIDLA